MWRARAAEIPDPQLRADAIFSHKAGLIFALGGVLATRRAPTPAPSGQA